MEQFLTQADNKVDAVLSENDGMAGGVVAALEAQGLAGKVPVSGQDGDRPPSTGSRSARRPSRSGRTPRARQDGRRGGVALAGGTTDGVLPPSRSSRSRRPGATR